jgi:large subunit ribosomal protein L7/L12
MTVLELSELIKALEDKFGVSAAAMAAPAAAAAAPAEEAAAEKSEYKVVLKDMGSEKMKVIKALRQVVTLGLVEAKNMVESAPVTIAEAVAKEEAQKMKETLEGAGAKVELA